MNDSIVIQYANGTPQDLDIRTIKDSEDYNVYLKLNKVVENSSEFKESDSLKAAYNKHTPDRFVKKMNNVIERNGGVIIVGNRKVTRVGIPEEHQRQ